MPRKTDWVAVAERALDRMIAAKTQRTAAKWYADFVRATRAGARQERREQARAQKMDRDEYLDVPDYDDWWEIEVAFDY